MTLSPKISYRHGLLLNFYELGYPPFQSRGGDSGDSHTWIWPGKPHVKLGSGRRREEIPVQDTAQLSLPLPVSPCLSVRMTERSGVYTCPVSRIHDTSRLLPPISNTAHATFRFLLTSQSRQQRRRK